MKLFMVGFLILTGCLCGCARRADTASAPPTSRPGPGVFFVATNGNDTWSGRIAMPNTGNTDGPFATLPRALTATREFKAGQGSAQQSANIVIRGGTYFLNEPFALAPRDSPLNIVAYSGEQPILSGGRRITGWRQTTANGRNVWATDIPEPAQLTDCEAG